MIRYHHQQQIKSGLENRLLYYGSIYWLVAAHEKSGHGEHCPNKKMTEEHSSDSLLLENLSAKYKESVPIMMKPDAWKRHVKSGNRDGSG